MNDAERRPERGRRHHGAFPFGRRFSSPDITGRDNQQMATTRVYPDTNVALHYRPLHELDWCSLVDSSDVTLVITSVFLREVDEQKDRARGAIQKRAKRMNSWLTSVRKERTEQLRSGVHIEVSATEPELEIDFAKCGLVATVSDDKFVACMLRDRAHHPDSRIVCVTGDNTLAFKAQAHGFDAIDPPANARLEDEVDPMDLKVRELQRRIQDLETRAPATAKLGLRFPGGERHATVTVRVLEPLSDNDIDRFRSSEAAGLTKDSALFPAPLYARVSRDAATQYLDNLVAWLRWHSVKAIAQGLTIPFQLLLCNEGTGNAEDIDVTLNLLSDAVFVAERRPFGSGHARPVRPKPHSLFTPEGYPLADLGIPATPKLSLSRAVELLRNGPDSATVSVANGRPARVEFKVRAVKHRDQIELPRLDFWFETAEAVPDGGFTMQYTIHSASDIESGSLSVKVIREQGRVDVPPREQVDPGDVDSEDEEPDA